EILGGRGSGLPLRSPCCSDLTHNCRLYSPCLRGSSQAWEKLCQECKPSAGRCARSCCCCCCCRRLLPSVPAPGSGRAERRPASGKHVRGGGVGGCRGSRLAGSHAAPSGLGVPEASESALGRLEPGPLKSLRISVTLGQAPRGAPSAASSAAPGETPPSRAAVELLSRRGASKRRESWRTDGERLRSGRGCAGAAGGPDASLDTRREGWPGTAATGRHEARRRSPGVSVASSLSPDPPLQRSSSLNETLRYSWGRGVPSAMVAALTLGGPASGSRGQPPPRPCPEGAQRPGSEGLGAAAAGRGGLRAKGTETRAELYLLRLRFPRPWAASAPSSRATPPGSASTPGPSLCLAYCDPEHRGPTRSRLDPGAPFLGSVPARRPASLPASPRAPTPAPAPSLLAARFSLPFVANKLCGRGKGWGRGLAPKRGGGLPARVRLGIWSRGGGWIGEELREKLDCWSTGRPTRPCR
uniref:Uncharacterized protein n=1 Tax=Sus scrofa TaxID=9823 RepID=A0A8D0ZJD3_PIG